MSDNITITGLVATEPRHIVTSESLAISSFRLASTQRRFDRSTQKWIDGDTNWFTITAFRNLAAHVSASVHKGDRVLVTGRLRIREWQTDERAGTTVDIEADAIGHDLAWGTSSFSRAVSALANSAAAESEINSRSEAEPETGSETEAEAEAEAEAEPEESTQKKDELAGLPF